MRRSYFFALFACLLLSTSLLWDAYTNLHSYPGSGADGYPKGTVGSGLSHTPLLERKDAVADEETPDPSQCTVKGRGPEGGLELTLTCFSGSSPTGEELILHMRRSLLTDLMEPEEWGGQGPSAVMPRANNSVEKPAAKQVPELRLNAETDNYNVLFLGVDGDDLQMVSVYSVNHHAADNFPSVGVFIPTDTVFFYRGEEVPLEDIYRRWGLGAVRDLVEREMEVDTAYYVQVDRRFIVNLARSFDPILVDGERIDLENPFVRKVSPNDERIMAGLMEQVLRPSIFFGSLPELVTGAARYIRTDFEFTFDNLLFHYRLAAGVDRNRLKKVVLHDLPPQEELKQTIYRLTRIDSTTE